MTARALALFFLFTIAGCSSGSTTPSTPATTTTTTSAPPPILPASLTTAANATLSLPGCDALAQLSFGLGVPTVTCPSFTAPAVNVGTGCAAGISGTLIVASTAGAQTGSANWAYATIVRPGQQFVIVGGPIVVPSNLQFTARPTFNWTNVAC